MLYGVATKQMLVELKWRTLHRLPHGHACKMRADHMQSSSAFFINSSVMIPIVFRHLDSVDCRLVFLLSAVKAAVATCGYMSQVVRFGTTVKDEMHS